MSFGIESANIVGYDSFDLRGNSLAVGVGASFANVSGEKVKLGDLKVVGYGAEGYADGMIYAKKLDGFGIGGTGYYWFDISDEEIGELYGWYDDEGGVCYNDVELGLGEGLWLYSPSESLKLQSAGQVPSMNVAVALRGNSLAKMVSNPMPVTLTLGDIAVTGYGTEGYADGMIYAKKLDGFGIGGTGYYWFDINDEEIGELYGWYDDEGGVEYNSVEVKAGEGLWIYSPSDALSVFFPSPLAK